MIPIGTEPSRGSLPAGSAESPLSIDEVGREAFWQGVRLDLSATEVAFLACLYRRMGRNVDYDTLLQEVWGTPLNRGGTLGQVRSTVKRLRPKLAAASGDRCQIVAARGVGYRLELRSASQVRSRRARRWLVRVLLLAAAAFLAGFAAGWIVARGSSVDPGHPAWRRECRALCLYSPTTRQARPRHPPLHALSGRGANAGGEPPHFPQCDYELLMSRLRVGGANRPLL